MNMDMANFLIRSFRPHFQRQLVDYERTKFQEILEETPSKYKILYVHIEIKWKYDILFFTS